MSELDLRHRRLPSVATASIPRPFGNTVAFAIPDVTPTPVANISDSSGVGVADVALRDTVTSTSMICDRDAFGKRVAKALLGLLGVCVVKVRLSVEPKYTDKLV